MNKPVCLVLGAGAGIGGHVAKRFAREGYHACLARRTSTARPGPSSSTCSPIPTWPGGTLPPTLT